MGKELEKEIKKYRCKILKETGLTPLQLREKDPEIYVSYLIAWYSIFEDVTKEFLPPVEPVEDYLLVGKIVREPVHDPDSNTWKWQMKSGI